MRTAPRCSSPTDRRAGASRSACGSRQGGWRYLRRCPRPRLRRALQPGIGDLRPWLFALGDALRGLGSLNRRVGGALLEQPVREQCFHRMPGTRLDPAEGGLERGGGKEPAAFRVADVPRRESHAVRPVANDAVRTCDLDAPLLWRDFPDGVIHDAPPWVTRAHRA